jgi:hypothetical protein
MGVVLLAARTSSIAEFGAFSFAYVIYGVLLGLGRAIGGEVLQLRAAQSAANVPADSRRLLAVALLLGSSAGILMVATGLVIHGRLSASLIPLGALLPVLLSQDGLRYIFFAQQAPARAALIDLCWILSQSLLFAAVSVTGLRFTPALLFVLWGSAAGVALAVGIMLGGIWPQFSQIHHWVSRDRTRVLSFLTEYVVTMGPVFLAIEAIALAGGLTAVGAIRGAQFLFAPLVSLIAGARIYVLPSFGEVAHNLSALRARVLRVASVLVVGSALWSICIIILPDALGVSVLGATWSSAQKLLVATAVMMVVRCGAMATFDGFRALGGGRPLVTTRTVWGVLYLSGAALGATLKQASGAADGMAVASALGALVCWVGFWRASEATHHTETASTRDAFRISERIQLAKHQRATLRSDPGHGHPM